jgi:hypothetical protein
MERQPERVPRGPPRVSALCVELLSALQRSQALFDVAEQVSCGRQQLQILPGQGRRLICHQQRGVDIRPGEPPGGLPAARKLTVSAHRLPHLHAGSRSVGHLGSVAGLACQSRCQSTSHYQAALWRSGWIRHLT